MSRPPDEEVSMAVEMTVLCRELGVLPGPGGLLDQDAYHVHLLRETLHVLAEKEKQDMERKQAEARNKAPRVAGRRH
jgi:hypothetical protein